MEEKLKTQWDNWCLFASFSYHIRMFELGVEERQRGNWREKTATWHLAYKSAV